MGWFPSLFNWFGGIFNRTRDYLKSGFLPFHIWGTSPQFNDYTRDAQKLAVIFSNPALLKVFTLQCDLFSLAKVYVYDDNEELIEDDPALDRIANPNYLQNQSQWLWDYMFWKMVGNAYLYMDSNLVDRNNAPMYWLENHKIEWPTEFDRLKDKLIFSQSKLNELMKTEITYRYEDGTTFKFPLSKIATINDLTNGTGNWFKGYSRIDSLYKVISNSETSLDSKNINVRFTGKFLVSGTQDPNDVTKLPMPEDEKKSIEERVNSDKQVHAIKSMIDIKRFVDDLRVLELDKSYLADYYLIGTMYNIPRDVLEAYTSSTFENQEKARAGHVSYTLEPAGEILGATVGKKWGYDIAKKTICLSWDHLPFMQVFEKDRIAVKNQQVNTFNLMRKSGIPLDEINQFLDTNFTIDEKELKRQQDAAASNGAAGKSGRNGTTEKANAGAEHCN